ncbi:MAG: hypothetical protein ACYCOU_25900 [Sulfobacillus sp.]
MSIKKAYNTARINGIAKGAEKDHLFSNSRAPIFGHFLGVFRLYFEQQNRYGVSTKVLDQGALAFFEKSPV